MKRVINIWGYIAEKYKDEPIIAGFDIINEPCFVSDVAAFNDFFEKAIQKIRTVDNNHIVFLEGDDWAKDFSLLEIWVVISRQYPFILSRPACFSL